MTEKSSDEKSQVSISVLVSHSSKNPKIGISFSEKVDRITLSPNDAVSFGANVILSAGKCMGVQDLLTKLEQSAKKDARNKQN